jgi:hypothetical protein
MGWYYYHPKAVKQINPPRNFLEDLSDEQNNTYKGRKKGLFVVGWSLTSTEHKGSSFDGLCLRWYPCLILEHNTQPQII